MFTSIVIALIVVAVVALGLVLLRKAKKPAESSASVASVVVAPLTGAVAVPEVEDRPSQLVIGSDAAHPVVAVEIISDVSRFKRAEPVDPKDSGISRLSAALQAVPSVLTAAEASGKRLMEVVVNGNLAQAADGNGMRGFVRGSTAIKEHGRFFEVDKLTTMINAAAVWQVASVIVAQKHLADISAKLTELKDAVKGISQHLEDSRRSVIEGTYEYLADTVRAVQAGELAPAVRTQLEASEVQLVQVYRHLVTEYGRALNHQVSDTDTVGSEAITQGLVQKMRKLEQIGADISLCLRTRIAAWHVFSLYPGEPQLKLARRDGIMRHIEEARSLPGGLDEVLNRDLERIKSFWNKKTTLDERKREVREAANAAVQLVHTRSTECESSVVHTDQLMLAHSQPIHLLFEIEGMEIVGVRRETLPLAA